MRLFVSIYLGQLIRFLLCTTNPNKIPLDFLITKVLTSHGPCPYAPLVIIGLNSISIYLNYFQCHHTYSYPSLYYSKTSYMITCRESKRRPYYFHCCVLCYYYGIFHFPFTSLYLLLNFLILNNVCVTTLKTGIVHTRHKFLDAWGTKYLRNTSIKLMQSPTTYSRTYISHTQIVTQLEGRSNIYS